MTDLKYFRTYGIGKNVDCAYENMIFRELDIHEDLSNVLQDYNYISIEVPESLLSGFVELKLFQYTMYKKIIKRKIREPTTSEERGYKWFTNQYGDNSEYYFNIYNSDNCKNKCLALQLNNKESIEWKNKNNSKSKIGNVYRFIGVADYKFKDCDN